ncbi:sulfurtransferase [Streptomyces bungoensis]|uniref:Sulfurtransferase n=1 Tax=Streptomyces bungoensis TaxID=285568 RepID=A0A101T1E1_9ACTN|nr:rhodanese-like domain-containing protein [Streptomyces bungoensis]KUN83945.1 sulfurtransferase [Streptomyces bungoensis]
MSLFRSGPDRAPVDEAHRHTRGAGAEAVLPDVREQPEWNAGHAHGAVHAPPSRPAAGEALPRPARARPPVVNCRSGRRSRQAAEPPLAGGADAVDVKGGVQAWAVAGHPVVGDRGSDGSIA